MRRTLAILAVAIASGACACPSAWAQAADAGSAPPTSILWSGIKWHVKSGMAINPGGNDWSAANVFVDASGDLHMKIAEVGGTWYCAEVWTDATFGFGTFQWQVQTAVDQLDPNVVLGLFVYGPTALGPDGTHEFDIEYARFGAASGDNGWWTVFPNVQTTPPLLGRSHYPLSLGASSATTSRFDWSPSSVAFSTMSGFQPAGSSTNLLRSWAYQPGDPSATISQSPMPLHMNLWLYNGSPPTDGQGVEVVIHSFGFTPIAAQGPSAAPALPGRGPVVLLASMIGAGLWTRRRGATRRPTPAGPRRLRLRTDPGTA